MSYYKRFGIFVVVLLAIMSGPFLVMLVIQSINPVLLNDLLSASDSWLTGVPRDYNNPDTIDEMICSEDGKTCWANPAATPWTMLIIALGTAGAFLFVMIWKATWATATYARKGIPPVTKDELRFGLLGLNDDKIPFEIIVDSKNPDKLVARWKVVDSKWIQLFSVNRLSIYYELRMRLVDRGGKGSYVKAQDYKREMSYSAGTSGINPLKIRLRYNFNLNKGIILFDYDRRLQYGLIYKDGQFKIDYAYNFRFVTGEIKNPIMTIITRSGWEFRPTMFLLG